MFCIHNFTHVPLFVTVSVNIEFGLSCGGEGSAGRSDPTDSYSLVLARSNTAALESLTF